MALGSNRHALMRWLAPKSDEGHEKALKLWAPGTGGWLIEHADFISWVEGTHSLLWLNGIRKLCSVETLVAVLIGFANCSWVRQDYLDVRISKNKTLAAHG